MLRVYFVRHAQPEHEWREDRTRPLTAEGKQDCKPVLEFFKEMKIDGFYCSPYKRSIETIAATASYFNKEIITDERLREREKGPNGNNQGMFQKRWADHAFHEDGGESIDMVQERNMEAFKEILQMNQNQGNTQERTIIIGTHGTALSSILNYYDASYDCNSFLRIIDWMPYIVELDFEGETCIRKIEHLHIEKKFKGKARADKGSI